METSTRTTSTHRKADGSNRNGTWSSWAKPKTTGEEEDDAGAAMTGDGKVRRIKAQSGSGSGLSWLR